MIRWRSSFPEDVRLLHPHALEEIEIPDMEEGLRDPVRVDMLRKNAWTATDSFEVPIGMLGFIPIHFGVAEAWTIVTPRVQPVAVEFVLGCHDILESYIRDHSLHRVQAIVSDASPRFHRFVEHFGFTLESVMKAYTPDASDVRLYAKVIS